MVVFLKTCDFLEYFQKNAKTDNCAEMKTKNELKANFVNQHTNAVIMVRSAFSSEATGQLRLPCRERFHPFRFLEIIAYREDENGFVGFPVSIFRQRTPSRPSW